MAKAPDTKDAIKNDAKGALAPSQADSKNNGALAIDLKGEKDDGQPGKDASKQTPEQKALD